ncbi:MAG TPA: chemotaxis protein CheW [Clostridiales bacterium]|nr:chemotaxis protein CheW [Clostridiales bacterium]
MMDNQQVLSDVKQFITINVNEEYYGIDISYINSIERMQKITRVPKAQSYFTGIINLRGEIVPVMSLRRKIGLEDDVFDKKTRIIIMKLEPKYSIGIIVENVLEVITLGKENIEKAVTEDDSSSYVYGIGKHEDKLISLLDVEKVILD